MSAFEQIINQYGTDTSGKWVRAEDVNDICRAITSKCIEICENGFDTQMTSTGAADMIRQHFQVIGYIPNRGKDADISLDFVPKGKHAIRID